MFDDIASENVTIRSGEASQLRKLPAAEANNNTFPVRVEGGDVSASACPRWDWERWSFWSERSEVGSYVRVRVDDLLLITKDFCHWQGWDIDKALNNDYFLGPKVDEDFKSAQLLRMREASFKLWGNENVIPEDKSTHPSNRAVIDWLLKTNAGFTKTSAENAASLIKPAFGKKSDAQEK